MGLSSAAAASTGKGLQTTDTCFSRIWGLDVQGLGARDQGPQSLPVGWGERGKRGKASGDLHEGTDPSGGSSPQVPHWAQAPAQRFGGTNIGSLLPWLPRVLVIENIKNDKQIACVHRH